MRKRGLSKYYPFIGLGISSILGTFLQKFMATIQVTGIPELPPHRFHKPWFQTLYMFFSMFLSIFVYFIIQLKNGNKKICLFSISKYSFFILAVPALCDLTMTVLHIVAFLYLGTSISLIIGFCGVIFSALIERFVLKRKIKNQQLMGIGLIIFSMIFVSLSIIDGTGTPPLEASTIVRFFALTAKLFAHLLNAIKNSIEQHLTQTMKIDPTLIIAVEGFWGSLATLLIFVPIVSTKGNTNQIGFSENFADTFAMLSNSKLLTYLVIFEIFFILFLNIFHMFAIESTSALFETLYGSFQGALIWISQVIAYYLLKDSKYDSYKNIGEQWTSSSFIQLIGYLISIFGLMVYNDIIHVPLFHDKRSNYERLNNEAEII